MARSTLAVALASTVSLIAGVAASEPENDIYQNLDHTGSIPLPHQTKTNADVAQASPGKKGHIDRKEETDRPAGRTSKRAEPNYDGRRAARLDAERVLVWLPRIALYPIHLVLEYGVRKPLVTAFTWVEKYHVFDRIQRWLSFQDGQGGSASIFPTVFFDFGISPSIGIFSGYQNVGGSGHNLTLQYGFWPTGGWYHAIGGDTFQVFRDESGTVNLRGEFISRPDFIFNGIGPGGSDGRAAASTSDNERFYRLRLFEAETSLRAAFRGLNRFNIGLLYRNARITDSNRQPSLRAGDEVFDVTDAAEVPGFGETYNLLRVMSKLELDTRDPDRVFTPGSGLRLELFGSFSFDPGRTELNFFRWGGEAAAFLDLSGVNHVLGFRFYLEALEATGDAVVPLTELIELGGPEYLRGFLLGRYRGESAMVATLNYRWPLWIFLDAELFASLGNAFLGHWRDLNLKRMVATWGLSLRTNTTRDVSFDIMVAFGTNQLQRWGDNFQIDNVRITFGVNQGF